MNTHLTSSQSGPLNPPAAEDDAVRKHDQQTYPRPSADGSKIVLDSIVELPGSPLTVQQQRIDHLALNIAAVGLKQPLVVVAGNRLVNGRHRLHALRALRERDPQEFLALFPDAMIPVHVVPLDGRTEAEVMSALQIAEAPMQVDFTDAELVRAIAYLESKGYIRKVGRPGKGELRIGPTLRSVFGLSGAQVARAFWLALNPGRLPRKPARPARLSRLKKSVAKVDREDLAELAAWIEELRHQKVA